MTEDNSSLNLSDLIDKKAAEKTTTKAATDDNQSMQELLEAEKTVIPQQGDPIEGTVLEITKNAIYFDLGPFGIGVVRGRELFESIDTYADLKVGDRTSANIINFENENGNVELSFKHISRQQAWEDLAKKMDDKEVLSVKITDANKGGLLTTISGVTAFLPVSQLTPEHYPRVEGGNQDEILGRLKSYVGTKFKARVIGVDPQEDKLIISEKSAFAEQHKDKLAKYTVGQVVKGKVSGIVDFGVFIKFEDGLEGLVHISELAWQRIDDPGDIVRIGQEVEVKIIGVDREKVSLSMKKLQEDPWHEALKRYQVGQTVKGEVTKTTPFGAFVQLDQDIHGLAHISELSKEKADDPSKSMATGDKKTFKIISIDPENHRLGLSLNLKEEVKKEEKPKLEKAEDKEKKEPKADEKKKEDTDKAKEEKPVSDK